MDPKEQALAALTDAVRLAARMRHYIDKADVRLSDSSPEERAPTISYWQRELVRANEQETDAEAEAKAVGATTNEIARAKTGYRYGELR